MKHVMLDIETLGGDPGSVILSLGACVFGPDGISDGTFYRRIDIGSSLLEGFNVSQDTLNWWREQPKPAQAMSFLAPGQVPVRVALDDFSRYIGWEDWLWAKGPDYDCVVLAAAYKMVGKRIPWAFRNTRDVRTMLGLSGVTQPEPEVPHDPVSDAVAQAKGVIEAYRLIGRSL